VPQSGAADKSRIHNLASLPGVAEHQAEPSQVRDDLELLVRRLRSLSPAAWRSRRTAVEELLAAMERLTAEAEQRPARPVPEVADHALADAVSVLGTDAIVAIEAKQDARRMATFGSKLTSALRSTR
jgi:uncharacterized coiled-coil protein SlyX